MLTALKERFPTRVWPVNQDDERRVFQALDLFLDVLSGGNSGDLLERYLDSGSTAKGRSSGCAQRGETYKHLSQTLNYQPVYLKNAKSILIACREAQQPIARSDPIINSIRMNVLKILQGVELRTNLEEAGFPFSRKTWAKAQQHNKEFGVDSLYIQDVVLGHPEVSLEMKKQIQEHVMSDKYTYVLPQRPSFAIEEARALTTTLEQIYEDFPSKCDISLDKFRKLCTGKKDSATPTLRKWLHITDMCQICPQRKAAIRYLRALVSGIKSNSIREKISNILEEIILKTATDANPQLGRENSLYLDQFIRDITGHTIGTTESVKAHVSSIVSIGYHIYVKNLVKENFMARWNSGSMPAGELHWLMDWKESVGRGRGGIETSNVIHDIQHTSICGVAFQFLHPIHKEPIEGTVLVFSDVLDKTAAAAIAIEEAVIKHLYDNYAPFRELWDENMERFWSFYDAGRHYYCETFLYHALIGRPLERKYRSQVQILPGGHGKTCRLDGKAFGKAGVAGAQAALLKSNERLRTTAQLCAHVKQWKEDQLQKKTPKYQDLNPWFFVHWQPGQHPKSLPAIKMHSLQSSICWESSISYNSYFRTPSVKLTDHCNIFNEERGRQMSLVPGQGKLNPNEYCIVKKACTDKAGNIRTSWRLSNEDVEDLPEVNINNIEKRRRSEIGIDLEVQRPRKARNSGECKAKCKWTLERLREVTARGNTPPFTQADLQRECEQHGLSRSNGTKYELAMRIISHMESVQHGATQRAAAKTLAEYFCSGN